MKKKLIAIVASLAMVATLVPSTAFATSGAAVTKNDINCSGAETTTYTGPATTEKGYYGNLLGEGYEDNVSVIGTANGWKVSGALPYTEFGPFSKVEEQKEGHYLGITLDPKTKEKYAAYILSEKVHLLTDLKTPQWSTDAAALPGKVNEIVRLTEEGKTIIVDWVAPGGTAESPMQATAPTGKYVDDKSLLPVADRENYEEKKDLPTASADRKTLTFDMKNLTLLSKEDTATLNKWIQKVEAIGDVDGSSASKRKVTYAREAYEALSAELKAVIDSVEPLNKDKNYKKVYANMVDAEEALDGEATVDNILDKIARLKELPKTAFKDQAEIESYFGPLDEVNKLVKALDSSLESKLGSAKQDLAAYNTKYTTLIKKYVNPKYAAAEKIDLTKETLEDSELDLIRELKVYVEGEYIKTSEIVNFKQATYDALVAALEKVEKDAKSLANAEVTVAGADSIVYDGTKKTPELTVTIGGKEVPAEAYDAIYSDNKDAGEAIVTIIPKDESGYTGKKEATFTIKAAALTDAMVKSVANATYTGKAVAPAVTLEKGVTYDVTYKDNTAVGKATATITGTGNYTGTITKTFIVKPAKEAISSLKAGKKSLTVAYKAQTGAKYRIVYSPAKGQAKAVNTTATKKTIKSLKAGKTYKVKVRAYKVVDGKTYNGTYSTVKKVKVK